MLPDAKPVPKAEDADAANAAYAAFFRVPLVHFCFAKMDVVEPRRIELLTS